MVSKTYCDICGAEIPPPEIVYDTVMKKKKTGYKFSIQPNSTWVIGLGSDLCLKCGEKVEAFYNSLNTKIGDEK